MVDLVAHVIGVAEDFAAGNLERAGSDEWTTSQIARRSGMSVPALVEEWRVIAEPIESMMDQVPPGPVSLLIGDLVHSSEPAPSRLPAAKSSATPIT